MGSDDKIPGWFDDPPINFLEYLTILLREEVGKAQTSAECISSEQALTITLPDGKPVDLLAIVVNSLERTQALLDLAGRYAEIHRQTGKSED